MMGNSKMISLFPFVLKGRRGDNEYKRLEKIQTQMKDLNEKTIPECTRLMDTHLPLLLQQCKYAWYNVSSFKFHLFLSHI